MDFILSLAHFCELHGPTSVLCTQALPAACSICSPTSPASSPLPFTPDPPQDATSYFSSQKDWHVRSVVHLASGTSDGDRCASCRMSLPDKPSIDSRAHLASPSRDRPPLRTREDVHVCMSPEVDSSDDDEEDSSFPISSFPTFESSNSDSSCHSHSLDYVSDSSPVESETFSTLRTATIRTLSGEQLPRGEKCGPIWFGDAVAGYTIAYVFRLDDELARGQRRYYALIALAGFDAQRAFEACALIWSLFEQIALNIIQAADDAAGQEAIDDSPPKNGHVTPISAFLKGRTVDPSRGSANVRANNLAELVKNENFFYELHMVFVSLLQELGRLLGGVRLKATSKQSKYCPGKPELPFQSLHEERSQSVNALQRKDPASPNQGALEVLSSDDM